MIGFRICARRFDFDPVNAKIHVAHEDRAATPEIDIEIPTLNGIVTYFNERRPLRDVRC
jgi:hypothetical protein